MRAGLSAPSYFKAMESGAGGRREGRGGRAGAGAAGGSALSPVGVAAGPRLLLRDGRFRPERNGADSLEPDDHSKLPAPF